MILKDKEKLVDLIGDLYEYMDQRSDISVENHEQPNEEMKYLERLEWAKNLIEKE